MRFPKVSTTNINGLPLGYTEVEYLESTGTQYIDTEFKGNSTSKVVIRASSIQASGNTPLFGARDDTTYNNSFALWENTGSTGIRFDYSDTVNNTVSSKTWDISKINTLIKDGKDNYVNGVQVTSNNTKTFNCNYSFYLFNINTGNATATTSQPFNGKIYSCQIYNVTLVRDFIPCLDSNNRPCMYDRVEGKPHYNLGTGEFGYGKKIYGVEYLESSGTEYIDTGIKFDGANTKIELKTYEDSLTRTHSICGDDGNYFYYFRGTGNWAVGYHSTAANIDSYMSVGDNVFVIDKNNVYLNGVLAKTYTASSTVSSYNTLLFNRKTSLVDKGVVTMYYCRIWDNDVLVRDYVPVRDENNVGYMFDRVNHTLYENKGTGAFVVGKDTLSKSKAKIIKTKTTVSGLPYGFTEVEYLESNGGQYIDIGIQPTDTYGYRVRNTYTAGGGEQCAIGCMDSGNRFVGIYTGGSQVSGGWGSFVGYLKSPYPFTNDTIWDVSCNYKNSRKIIFNNEELKDISDIHITDTISNSVYLFARHYGTNITKMIGKVYCVEITNGQDVMYKFIPALDSNDRPCMYDLVEGKAYYNQGTGEFTYGPKIIPVEYLESTGTQYIDTGYIPNQDTSIISEFEYTKNPGNMGFIFGAGYSATDRAFELYPWTNNWNSPYGNINIIINTSESLLTSGKIYATKNKNNILIRYSDGTEQTGRTDYTTFTVTNRSMWLFAINRGSTTFLADCVKLYSLKAYDNNTLVRDYIPVKDENNVGYMFDKIGHTLYANAGTGSFVVGDEKRLSRVRFIEDTSVISEYTKVKCLISSGTQYIDTGLKGKNNIDYDYKVNFTQVTTSSGFGIGGEWENSKSLYLGLIRSNGTFAYHYGNTASPVVVLNTIEANKDYSIQGHMWSGEQYMTINGTKSDIGTISGTFTSTQNITLFRVTSSSPIYCYAKIYGCKIWDNNALIRDYIPVLRNSDNKPGMYDRVTKTFFTNQGTGEFTYETL